MYHFLTKIRPNRTKILTVKFYFLSSKISIYHSYSKYVEQRKNILMSLARAQEMLSQSSICTT